ncbi:hypothetical protein AB0435_34260, partial [Streptomyces sp. NPDC051173]
MTGAAERAWTELNERQRLYLSVIFEFDQAAEANIKQMSAKRMATPPAAEWRQVTYDIKLPKEIAGYTSVQQAVRRRDEHDTGSGATLAALRRRKLITVTYDQVHVPPFGMVDRIRVRLTAAGRAAARHGIGHTAPATPPPGLMTRWSLLALARLYTAGDRGLSTEVTGDRADAAPSWNTLLRLRDRRDGSLIEVFTADWPDGQLRMLRQHRVRASVLGRRHFEIHRACYAELFPDLAAELPETAPAAGAHAGLADHRRARPKHQVRDIDLRLLTALAELEATGHSYLRETLVLEFERRGEEVPGWVGEIPSGLLRWQVKAITRTEKSIDRLAEHPAGALVEQVDVHT